MLTEIINDYMNIKIVPLYRPRWRGGAAGRAFYLWVQIVLGAKAA